MWNSITSIWGKNPPEIDEYDSDLLFKSNLDSKDISVNFILTKDAPRDSTPIECAIKLWPHQEAMLHRVREIERANYLCKTEHSSGAIDRYMNKKDAPPEVDVCLGVMNDPPGSGKTYAILSRIVSDKVNKGASIIIVPQNIYGQWRQSIEIVFKDSLHSCKFSTSYVDVMEMYGNPDTLNKYKVILLQDNFAEAYFKVINDNKLSVCRVVVDEIDIMDRFICSSIQTKFVWLMSASYTNQKRLGPYHIGDHTRVVCKCDVDFVAKSLNLPDPCQRVIECDDAHIQLFKNILSEKELVALNAGDLNIINRLMNQAGHITSHNIKDKIGKCSEYFHKKSEQLEESQLEYERLESLIHINENDEKDRNILRDTVSKLKTFRTNSRLLLERLDYLPDIMTLNIKETHLEDEFINAMLMDRKSKWLFFNDNGNVLIRYQEFLLTKEIKAVMLDGGNQKLIEKTLKDYKEGDVQVLLLNSMIEGAGMNLENTTHLVFMHKTEEKFIQQVIGRAQRYGREAPLNIIMLFNKNE